MLVFDFKIMRVFQRVCPYIIYILLFLFSCLITQSFRSAQNLPVLLPTLAAGNALYIASFFYCQHLFAKKNYFFYQFILTHCFSEKYNVTNSDAKIYITLYIFIGYPSHFSVKLS